MAFSLTVARPDGSTVGNLSVVEGTPIPERGDYVRIASKAYIVAYRIWGVASGVVKVVLVSNQEVDIASLYDGG